MINHGREGGKIMIVMNSLLRLDMVVPFRHLQRSNVIRFFHRFNHHIGGGLCVTLAISFYFKVHRCIERCHSNNIYLLYLTSLCRVL